MTDLEQRARDAISISAGDYERRAKVNRLAAEEDLPADFVDANLDYVEKEKLRKGLDLSGVPNTAGFYSAPSNAEVAGDDVDKFARWEREINTFDEGKFFGEHTLKLLSDATTNLGTSTLRGSANLIQGFKDTLVQGGFQSFEGGRERYKQYAAEEERKRAAGESVGILESFKQAENPYLFGEETTTPVDIKESFSEGEYMETAGNVGQFIYDTGVQSIPQMISYFTPLGVATSSIALTQNIAEKIAENNGEEVNAGHMVMAAPWSAASIMLDKYGLGLMTKAGKTEMELLKEVAGDLTAITARNAFGSAIKAGGKAAFGEGSTEFSQEIIEYVGERFGTEAKIDMAEAVEQGAWAFLAGGAMGGVIGTPAAYLNERERRIRAMKDKELQNDFDSLREQDLLDSVITQSQEFASVKRAPEVVEQFFQSVGGDKSVLIPQSVVRQAIAEGAEIPPVLTGKLDPTGLDIRVPLSEFVTQIATNPDLVNLLRPHMRMREDGVSLSDIESRINRPTIEAMLGRQDKVTRIQKENAEALKELEDGLVSTGMHSKNTARLVVRLYAEYADRVSTDLKNAGHDVEVKDVIERARLKFAGPKADLSGKWAFENAAKEMVNLGRIEKEDFQKLDVSVQRDMVAQFNAAKPKDRGGLGLKADNSREDRAKAMGKELVEGEVYDPITASAGDVMKQSTMPDKIEIDGVERHTKNSNGDYIAANEDGVRNFYAWFGKSKVVDAEGRPLVVYHGGKEGIEEFDAGKAGSIQSSDWGRGIYFTPTEWVANSYKEDANKATNEAANAAWDAIEAKSKEYGTDPMYVSIHLNSKKITQEQYDEIKALEKEWRDALGEAKKVGGDVYAVYLRMEDPLYYTYDGITDHTLSMQAKAQGKDGLIVEPMTEYVVFDPTQIKSVANVGTFSGETANIYYQSAFHGSPYRFDKFSLDHMGKGEGAQAYGYGLYFAGDKEVAEHYRQVLTVGEEYVDGQILDSYNPMHMLAKTLSQESGDIGATAESLRTMARPGANKDVAESAKSALVLLEQGSRPSVEYRKADGQLYRVEIPEDDTYLLWDKPLSEQSEVVMELLIKAVSKNNPSLAEYWKKSTNMDEVQKRKLRNDLNLTVFDILDTGGAIYESFGDPEKASKYLNTLGINGIKYLDGTSRGKGDGSYNYVIFDDAAIEIVETYYQRSESGFFSQLQKAAEELKQEKGTPDQMLAMLKKAGAKDAEIDATGLKEFLELAGKSITKAQIVEFVSNNGVQVETTVLGAEVEEKEDGFTVSDDDGRRMASFETEEEADSYASENGGFVEPSTMQQVRETRARNTTYTLPGGENHIELVLSIPNIEGWNQGDTTHYGDIADGKAVAWVRANDRTDEEGKKVLFIEEIQSKRAQEGRSKGFNRGKLPDGWVVEKNDSGEFSVFNSEGEGVSRWRKSESAAISESLSSFVPSAPFVEKTDAWVSLAMKRMITYAVENGYDRIAWTTGEQQADRYDLSKQVDKITWQKNTDGTITVEAYRNGDEVISEVAKDIDGVSGLIGKDLAKKIGEDISGTRKVKQTPLSKDEEGRLGFIEGLMRDGSSMSPKDWTVYNTLIAKRDGGEAKVSKKVKGTIEGDGLKVGGEGMKSFYDKIIPSIAKEVTKKIGGDGVKEISIIGKNLYDFVVENSGVGSSQVLRDRNTNTYLADAKQMTFTRNAEDGQLFRSIGEARNMARRYSSEPTKLIQPGFDITDKMREQVETVGLPLFQKQGEAQAVIHNFPFGDRVIQLFDKQNLSSVLHESAHLFLLMEADLAAEFGVTKKQEALLKWLGVDSFDDIRRVHHEKFARTFEAYLFEGKAPSLALADVFSRMKEWMVRVYEFIRNIPEAQIDPEVREIFDRMLATDQKIEEMRANPAYDQFFSSKDSAGMSQSEWEKYLEKVKRSESKAKETVDEKLLKEWKRYRMKEWIEERDVIRDNEEVILKGQPVYRAVEALKKGKLNRAQLAQLMKVDLDADKEPLSLLEFAKSIGGMNVDDFISHGVDPADMKVFPRGTFTKDGKTLGGFAEAAAEEGYIVGTSSYEETYEDSYDDNDFLDLVMREIHGEKAYTSEGMEYFAQKDADEKYQEDYFAEHGEYPAAPEETEQDKLIKKLKKMSKKDGLDIALFSADMGFESPRDMMDQVLSVRPVKEQAKENAQAAMLDKYGDSLRDDVLQEEVKEALANEDTAELVLMEINAMNRKVKRKSMDMEYIKQKARDLIAKMKKKEMRPSSYYNMMLKAAEKSKKANSEAAKINAAIAVERSKAAEELMAEVSGRAKDAKVEYDKAEKDYKEKAESARDVSRDKAVAKKKYDEAKKISDEARKQADELIKATEKAKKKSAKKPGDIALKAEYDALVESRDVAKKSAADAEKETAKFKSLMERLANDYNSLFDLQVAAKKVMDNQKKIMEEQGFRLEEKTGRAAELKTEAGKKMLELEKDLDRVSKEAAEAKAQQLANHHLFKEATEAQKRIDTQVRYLRKVKAKTYNPKEVDPDYIAQAKALINLFDMKHYKAGMTAEEKSQHQADMDRELDRILTWYESQVMSTEKLNELNQDENGTGNRNTLQWLSEDLVAALAAKKEASDKGVPFTFKMTNIEYMTAGQIQGLYDTIKNIRLVGGKNSEYSKAEYQREQEEIGEEVKEHSTKTITPTMEPTLMEGAKRTFKAEWSSMRNIHGILYTLAGGNPDSKLMKAYESIVDAVNRHITLEHDFAKMINDAMGPILRTMANPFNHNYTKADGKVWSLSNQARFTLLMNMGNQSNLDALILGFNNTYPEMGVFTHADLLGMVSGMGKPVYEAANKIWAYKDSVTWPLSSAIQRKVDGVTTAKIDPVPFVVDGFSLTGGHYRLHYIPLEGEGVGKDIGEETHASKTMNMGKIASQFSRVGSGGRAVDIGTFHLYRDIDEELRFIAYKELTIKMSRMFNGVKNPLRGAIVRHYGREYMQNLEDTIGRMVNPQVVKSGMIAKIGRYVRANMVYAFLAFSIRNVMQATYSFAAGAAQLGGADYVIWSLLKFYSNPMENFKEVHESSAYMRDRIVFINHETMTQMSRLSMWSPLMTPLKKIGWSLHAVVDGMQAYPYWMEAKRQYLRDNQVTKDTDFKAREKAANDYADLTVKQIMGSGHPLDIGSAFTNPDDLHTNLVFMGAFANTTYNANAHNIEAFKRGKIPWYELARRLGWYTVLGPIMVMGVLGQLAPEEDEDEEDFWKRIMSGILGYNAGQVIGLGHLSNIFLNDRGFDLPMFQAIESAKSVGKIAGQVYGDVTGEEDIEFDARMQARLVRSLSMMFPIFGASQWAKLIEGYDDDNQDFWGMLVEGKQK